MSSWLASQDEGTNLWSSRVSPRASLARFFVSFDMLKEILDGAVTLSERTAVCYAFPAIDRPALAPREPCDARIP